MPLFLNSNSGAFFQVTQLMDEIMSPICRHRHHMGFRHPARFALLTIIAGGVVFGSPASAQQQAPKPTPKSAAHAAVTQPVPGEPTLLAMFGEWGAYKALPSGKKVCFALAKPVSSSTTPPNRPRDPIWMFISSRPGEKVRDEVSVIFGYGLKPNADATIEIADGSYAMNTQGDGAWVRNPAEEPKLVETLRKGANVTVKGTSAKGTVSTDVYSLRGLAQALDRVGQECR
jgi:invasion protein IalB